MLHIKNVEESLTEGLMNELDLRTHGWPKLASWEKCQCAWEVCAWALRVGKASYTREANTGEWKAGMAQHCLLIRNC